MPAERINVADRLSQAAAAAPDRVAVVACNKRGARQVTFAQLDADPTAVARGLVAAGVRPGTRLVLLVPPSPEFVTLVFALLRSGATTILIDPGMGRKHLVDCLAATEPEGFVAVSRVQAVRTVLRRRFPRAKLNVTVGRRWFWGGATYKQLLAPTYTTLPASSLPATHADDPAAIIFTSGSTGPPKGVLYTHRMFETQVAEIQRAYDLQHGGVDLACFALFGLFNAAMGVTTVFPEMDFSRPATADPRKLLAAANEWKVTQAFASPAVWDRLSRHCEQTDERIPTLRKIISCGAPVPADVLRRTLARVADPGAQMHTPYGATEALPISTIEAREILGETAAATSKGAGVCVGRKFDSIDWRLIRITDEPIANIDDAEELPTGEIGELIVRGPQVSPSYLPAPSPRRGGGTEHGRQWRPSAGGTGREAMGRGEAGEDSSTPNEAHTPSPALPTRGREPELFSHPNDVAKIADGAAIWHRMGDVGSFDAEGRFWYHGRKSQRVETGRESLFTERCEAVFRGHPAVRQCALVAVGPRGAQTPIAIIEPNTAFVEEHGLDFEIIPYHELAEQLLELAAANPVSAPVTQVLFYPLLPVDVRHNAKINREQLAAWAARRFAGVGDDPARTLANSATKHTAPPASSLQPPA